MTLRPHALGALIVVLALIVPATASAAVTGPICTPLECAASGPVKSVSFAGAPTATTSKKKGNSRKARRGTLRVVIKKSIGQRPKVLVRGPGGQRYLLTRSTTIKNARPGIWRVVADPIGGFDAVSFATQRVTKVRLGAGARGRVVVAYNQKVSTSARVADPAAVQGVTATADGRRQVAIADPDHKLEKGAVLSAGVGPNTPHGMLLTVDDVERSGDTAIITGSDAPMTAIGPQADISVQPRVSLSKAEFQRALQGDGRAAKSGSKGYDRPYKCSAGVSANVDGDVDFDAGTKFDVEWGGLLHPLTIRAMAKATFDQSGKFTVTVSGKAKCELDVELLPKDIEFSPIEFMVGPVPVVIVPKLNFLLQGEANVGGYIKTTVTESVHAGIGVKWDDGLKPIKEWDTKFSYTKPEPGWNADLKVSVGPKLIFDVYDFAGPYITAGIYAKFQVDSDKRPWWSLHAGLEAGVGIRLKVWKIKFDKGIPDLVKFDKTLAEAQGDPPPVITTDSLHDARSGDAYSTTLDAYRGKKPYTWSIKRGKLPNGLTFNPSTAKITGTPTEYGTFRVTVQAKDKKGETDDESFDLEVKAPWLRQTATKIASGVEDQPYSTQFEATGSIPPYKWSVTKGDLPPGVSLDADTGVISGTSIAQGDYSFDVTVRGKDDQRVTRTVPVFIDAAPLVVHEKTLAEGMKATAYSESLSAYGGTKPWKWSVSAGTLPYGLTLDPATGKISGTPSWYGTSPITVLVTDAKGRTASRDFTVPVKPKPLVLGTTIPAGREGLPYSATIGLTEGAHPYTWAMTAGTMPAGLSFDTATGTISGTPASYSSTLFTVKVTDSAGQTISRQFNLKINPVGLAITSTSLGQATVGTPFSVTPTRTGGAPPFTWTLTGGALPAGLSLNSSTGEISGTPSAAGTENPELTVTDSMGNTTSSTLPLVVNPASTVTLTRLDCATASFCMTTDGNGHSYKYDGTTWSPAGDLHASVGLDCASPTLCISSNWGHYSIWDGTSWTQRDIAATGNQWGVACAGTQCFSAYQAGGQARMWRWNGVSWSSTDIGASSYTNSFLTCPSATFCMAGYGNKLATYNGTTWSSLSAAPGNSVYWTSGACASSTACVIMSNDGLYSTWNGTTWSTVDTAGAAPYVDFKFADCSRTETFCVATGEKNDGSNDWATLTWDGTSWTDHGTLTTAGTVYQASCPTSTFCAAAAYSGDWLAFDGTAWGTPAPVDP